MVEETNPFHELYVTETIRPKEFVSLFSPFLVKHALALFRRGNVVLRGTQGSGKSMLLHLLKPEIRLAYHEADEPFPVPDRDASFLGCGINLRRSLAIEFGQRPIGGDGEAETRLLPLYFGDFLNYWIVRDLFRSLDFLRLKADGALARKLELVTDERTLDMLAARTASDPCWFGFLDGVITYESLLARLDERLTTYRQFLNYNLRILPDTFSASKTVINEPISRTIGAMRACGAVPQEVNIFVRIDQYEELNSLEDSNPGLGAAYRQIINKALGTRDPHVSYRVGSRRYAWTSELSMYGTSARLELDRDYRFVDLDELLRRKENRRTWIFPAFGDDVFRRRIQYAGFDPSGGTRGLLWHFFGPGLTPDDLARRYTRSPRARAFESTDEWPPAATAAIHGLIETEPLQAQLLTAWYRQRFARLRPPAQATEPSVYWRKERVQHALMQTAARSMQRMVWAGADDVLSLSGGNILIFIDLCQQIWSAGLQAQRETRESRRLPKVLPRIEPADQAVGIFTASTHWYHKITEQPGGDSRQRFVALLGALFRTRLLGDDAMSYPGHNGFSLRLDELRNHSDVEKFLNDCVDFGDLVDAPHTTKLKDRRQRRKWYLNPILSPFFNIPVSHVKEPIYAPVDEVQRWMQRAEIPSATAPPPQPADWPLPLFDSDPQKK